MEKIVELKVETDQDKNRKPLLEVKSNIALVCLYPGFCKSIASVLFLLCYFPNCLRAADSKLPIVNH